MSTGQPEIELPEALRQARPLLSESTEHGQLRTGYLDLLGATSQLDATPQLGATSQRPGAANQTTWESRRVSSTYDHFQSVLRRFASKTRLPPSAKPPEAGRVLDVGCGPGNLTAQLGRACGRDGIALGVDISAPMLERAAAVESSANTGFLRADARALPFHDDSFHVVTSIATVHNVPEPDRALRELARVLAPGGRLVVMALAEGGRMEKALAVLGKRFNVTGLHPDRTAELLHAAGAATVHTRIGGSLLRIDATKAS